MPEQSLFLTSYDPTDIGVNCEYYQGTPACRARTACDIYPYSLDCGCETNPYGAYCLCSINDHNVDCACAYEEYSYECKCEEYYSFDCM